MPALTSIDQIPHAIQASPVVMHKASPPATVSAIPSMFVKGATKARRGMIIVSSGIVLLVLALVAVMVFSRMH